MQNVGLFLATVMMPGTLFAAVSLKPDLVVKYDRVIDRAVEIAKANIRACKAVKGGMEGFTPGGQYDGIWLSDSVFLLEGYKYWAGNYERFLYSHAPGALGLVPKFAEAQDDDGYIPMAFWGDAGRVDYGGRYDLAQGRKQNRDMESPYTFIHANYLYWKDYDTTTYIERYYGYMKGALKYLERLRDKATGLISGTYGPPNSDVCVDWAVPKTTAHPYFNALYVQAFRELSEMAQAIGERPDAANYGIRARELREAINEHLWSTERRRYELKILRTPVTTDKTLPAYKITEDTRFPVVDNMMLLLYHIPSDPQRIETLIAEIEKAETGLKVYGQMVKPHYPDNFFTKQSLFNNGNYHNGDVWTWFSNKCAIPLFELGYPDKALDILRRQAEVAVRDNGFSEYYEDDSEGHRKGAFPYTGPAATYQYAIVEGLFGLKADYPSKKLYVHPSLKKSGRITTQLGQHVLAMKVDANEKERTIKLAINTTYAGQADFRVLLTPDAAECSVAKNGRETIPCRVRRIGKAVYAVFVSTLGAGDKTFAIRYRAAR